MCRYRKLVKKKSNNNLYIIQFLFKIYIFNIIVLDII